MTFPLSFARIAIWSIPLLRRAPVRAGCSLEAAMTVAIRFTQSSNISANQSIKWFLYPDILATGEGKLYKMLGDFLFGLHRERVRVFILASQLPKTLLDF